MSNISALDFDVMIGDFLVHVESMSATITDNRQVAKTRGIPDGDVNGDVECTGEIELDQKNSKILTDAARSAGSFRDLEPFDILCDAAVGQAHEKIELFGVRLNISDLFSIENSGAEKSKRKFAFYVTSPDFVRIDGVPYLSEHDTRHL